jgi:hypothetical protein
MSDLDDRVEAALRAYAKACSRPGKTEVKWPDDWPNPTARAVMRLSMREGLLALAAKQEAIVNLADEAMELLADFVTWSEAYPTDIFSEPDYAKAHELLKAGGMTLDAISASIMRRATETVGNRARDAIAKLTAAAKEKA